MKSNRLIETLFLSIFIFMMGCGVASLYQNDAESIDTVVLKAATRLSKLPLVRKLVPQQD